jgi:hypothetical protein
MSCCYWGGDGSVDTNEWDEDLIKKEKGERSKREITLERIVSKNRTKFWIICVKPMRL